ncbi:unnamed protein product [Moneuplotes crassus]|uniref:Replication protein A subunit n=1 Tax=Euplotes crassus TaxID=5936 RepID=A0AAD1X7R8_EUPCR|nr:unnamed protein product [Moneuplotes crassus]
MSRLTYDCIRSILEHEDQNLSDGIIVQILNPKVSTLEDKIYCKGAISCGNLSVYCVIKGTCAKESKEQYGAYELNKYDVVKFTKWQVKEAGSSTSKQKTFLIISGPYQILKTGLTSNIGNPRSYYDFPRGEGIPAPDPKNCIIPGSASTKEEVKESPAIKSKGRKSTIRMDGSPSKDVTDDYMPIKAISNQTFDWVILAKVTSKSAIRHYNNKNGPGKLFNVELADGYGTQIQATAFNAVVDKFYDMIEVGKIYRISNCSVKVANKKFSSIKHDYCLFINENSTFAISEDQGADIADVQISRIGLHIVANTSEGNALDLVCIPIEDYGTREILTKSGQTRKLRTILVVDDTKTEKMEEDEVLGIEVQIWGDKPENIRIDEGKILVIKGCRTNKFRDNISITCGDNNSFYYFEDVKHIKEMLLVMKWYKGITKGGKDIKSKVVNISGESSEDSSKTPTRMLIQADIERLEYYYTYVTLDLIRADERAVYTACPECRKKIDQSIEGKWECHACSKAFDKPNYTYMLSCKISDGYAYGERVGVKWLSAFGDQGQQLIGSISAHEYYKNCNEDLNDRDKLKDLAKENQFKKFRVLIKKSENEYQGEIRDRFTAIKIFPSRVAQENTHLLDILNQYNGA